MKKILLIVALLTISLTTLSFGQATVGGWGRGIFVPVAVADGEITSILQRSWDAGEGCRIGFTISGSSDNIGAQADILFDGGTVATGDQVKIWAKPIDMLTISVGSIFDDTLRGNAGFCANNWARPAGIIGDDVVFMRIGCDNAAHFAVTVAPVDGAYIYASLGENIPSWWNPAWGTWDGRLGLWDPTIRPHCREDILVQLLEEGQYGAGYDIPGIGVLRAQFLGKASAIEEAWGEINAAFKLTMVEGLIVDLGAFIPTDTDQTAGGNQVARIGLYANYVMDTLALHLASQINLTDEDEDNLGFHVGIGVEYGLDGGLTLQGDFRFANNIYAYGDPDADSQIDVGAFAKWSYSNGIFGAGIQASTNNFTTGVVKEEADAMAIVIPIRVEYWF